MKKSSQTLMERISENRISFTPECNNICGEIKSFSHWSRGTQICNTYSVLHLICANTRSLVNSVHIYKTYWEHQLGFSEKFIVIINVANNTHLECFQHRGIYKNFLITWPHVFYMLECPCHLAHVGQTNHHLKSTLAEHKGAIRNGNVGRAIAGKLDGK